MLVRSINGDHPDFIHIPVVASVVWMLVPPAIVQVQEHSRRLELRPSSRRRKNALVPLMLRTVLPAVLCDFVKDAFSGLFARKGDIYPGTAVRAQVIIAGPDVELQRRVQFVMARPGLSWLDSWSVGVR